ncbi:hypothetical protein PENSPDRAFT_692066 [Peniophora sp. CONT]|nr:hypothetical protein PENSPDRAFT_692066 [Peniophora sp. CONT]
MFSALRISAFLCLTMAIFSSALVAPAPTSPEFGLEQRDESSLLEHRAESSLLEQRDKGSFPYCWEYNPWPQPGRKWCGYKWGNIPWWSIPWNQIPFQYVPWGGIKWYGARNPWCPWNPLRICFPPGPPRPFPFVPTPPPPPPSPPTTTVFVTVTAGTTSTITSVVPQRTFPPGFIPGAAPPV